MDEWNGANVRLKQIEGELAVNGRRLATAKKSLRTAQTTVEERLVTLYQEGEVDVVEVVLGATSFDDLIDGLDTANRVAEDDARIVEDVADLQGGGRAQTGCARAGQGAADRGRRPAGRPAGRDRAGAGRAPRPL